MSPTGTTTLSNTFRCRRLTPPPPPRLKLDTEDKASSPFLHPQQQHASASTSWHPKLTPARLIALSFISLPGTYNACTSSFPPGTAEALIGVLTCVTLYVATCAPSATHAILPVASLKHFFFDVDYLRPVWKRLAILFPSIVPRPVYSSEEMSPPLVSTKERLTGLRILMWASLLCTVLCKTFVIVSGGFGWIGNSSLMMLLRGVDWAITVALPFLICSIGFYRHNPCGILHDLFEKDYSQDLRRNVLFGGKLGAYLSGSGFILSWACLASYNSVHRWASHAQLSSIVDKAGSLRSHVATVPSSPPILNPALNHDMIHTLVEDIHTLLVHAVVLGYILVGSIFALGTVLVALSLVKRRLFQGQSVFRPMIRAVGRGFSNALGRIGGKWSTTKQFLWNLCRVTIHVVLHSSGIGVCLCTSLLLLVFTLRTSHSLGISFGILSTFPFGSSSFQPTPSLVSPSSAVFASSDLHIVVGRLLSASLWLALAATSAVMTIPCGYIAYAISKSLILPWCYLVKFDGKRFLDNLLAP